MQTTPSAPLSASTLSVVAVILAAGVGKRMNSDIPKQYLKINDKEILYYTIRAFEKSKIDEMIIVTGNEEIDYCKNQIVDKYKFTKKLMHGDFGLHNMLFLNGELVGIIDPQPLIGDALYDLIFCLLSDELFPYTYDTRYFGN